MLAVTIAEVDSLIQRARAGDPGAFRELFSRHREDVARIVFRLLGPGADVEDVVQEVFIQVFRSIGTFQGQAKFSTWLYRVTANVARMQLRRQLARPRAVLGKPLPEPSTTTEAGPDEGAETRRRVHALYGLLDRLSEKKRTVLVLHDFEGVPAEEIAQVVEAPVLTVRTRLFYARRELYAAMAEEPALADCPLPGVQLRGRACRKPPSTPVSTAGERESLP